MSSLTVRTLRRIIGRWTCVHLVSVDPTVATGGCCLLTVYLPMTVFLATETLVIVIVD